MKKKFLAMMMSLTVMAVGLFAEVKKDIIQLILKNPKDGEGATDLLLVAKYFERIGDHATNIAEWVIYSLQTQASNV